MEVSDAGMTSIAHISTQLENWVGFSSGMAELTLKKPPPLVPSILIASCEATGPVAIVPSWPPTPLNPTKWPSVCTTPWDASTMATISDSGSST